MTDRQLPPMEVHAEDERDQLVVAAAVRVAAAMGGDPLADGPRLGRSVVDGRPNGGLGHVGEMLIHRRLVPTQAQLRDGCGLDPGLIRYGVRVANTGAISLVPGWAKDLAIGNKMINARAETVAEKPGNSALRRDPPAVAARPGGYVGVARKSTRRDNANRSSDRHEARGGNDGGGKGKGGKGK